MADPDLSPFILADKGLIANSLVELEQGRKRSHWMWFIFPQLAGRSTNPSMMSQRYAIRDLQHARALLEHPVLGERLRTRTEAVLRHTEKSPEAIFDFPDCLKFHSCMTLFAHITGPESCFQRALDAFYDGAPDTRTLELVERHSGP